MASTLHMHPWYRLPTGLKRKTSLEFDPSPSNQGQKTQFTTLGERETSPMPKSKRRRCDNLEHGFSQLSLSPSVIPQPTSPSSVPSIPFDTPNTVYQSSTFPGYPHAPYNTNPVSFIPASANHVACPSAPLFSSSLANGTEVQYSENLPLPENGLPASDIVGFSWYEPEKDRIIITDLETSPPSTPPPQEKEEKDTESSLHVSLPSSLLKRLNERDTLPSLLRNTAPDSDPSKALVLFRPLNIPTVEEPSSPPTGKSKKDLKETTYGLTIGVAEDDAIEAEDIPIIEEPPATLLTSALGAATSFGPSIERDGAGYFHIEGIHHTIDDDAMDIE